MEFASEAPRGHFNQGRRAWGEDQISGDRMGDRAADRGNSRSDARFDTRSERPRYPSRAAPAPRDPFFDKPYETPVTAAPAPWETTAKTGTSKVSANIKSKKKVAALFKILETKVDEIKTDEVLN